MAIAPDNTLGNLGSILQSIPGLSQAVNGSTSTTTNSGISSTGLSALLTQILSSTNGLASVASGQNTAGLYNSTVQQQSINDLLTRSAGEVASKGPTSETTTKAPTLSLGDTLLQGAAGLIGTKLLGKGVDALGSTVSDALGLGSTTQAGGAAAASSLLSGTTGSAGAFTAGGAIPTSVANAGIAGSAASEASAGAAGITGSAGAEGGIGLTGAGALDAGLGAGLGITGAATGAATAGGLAAGGATLGGLGGAVAGDVAASTAGIAAAEGVGAGAAGASAGFGIGDALAAAAEAWVICTELEAQGVISNETYQKAAPNFISKMRLKPSAVRGYHYWAIRYTKLMRRNDWIGRLATATIKPLATGRTDYINGKWNLRGWITFSILEPICSFLGKTVARKPQDWKSLYQSKTGR